jgi:nitrite reductase/ring-hydroxylating ferredoxin subunit
MDDNWIKLFKDKGEADEIVSPNSVRRILIGEKAICFANLNDGFFAIDDECPHQSASLGMGDCKPGGRVECPFHHYLFDVRTGKQLQGLCPDVETFPVKQDSTGIYVKL